MGACEGRSAVYVGRMPLSHLRLSEIAEADIQSLVDAPAPEGQRIDYKRTTVAKVENDRLDLLKDVAAFANAEGGDIVLGVVEKKGVPTEVIGLPGVNPDAEMRRLHSILQNGIDPPVTPSMRAIPVATGDNVIVIRIPRSWAAPHMVTLGNEFRFWIRKDSQNEAMRVEELRRSFAGYDYASERVREFVTSRITQERSVVRLEQRGRYYLHMTPLSLADPRERFTLPEMQTPGDPRLHPPVYRSDMLFADVRYTADGIVISGGPYEERKRNYVLAFRNGAVELVDTLPFRNSDETEANVPFFFAGQLEEFVIQSVRRSMAFQRDLGVRPPLVCTLSIRAPGSRLHPLGHFTAWTVSDLRPGIDSSSELITGPEIVLDDWFEDGDVPRIVRPLLDFVWNAGGWARSTSYDADGEWKRPFDTIDP